MSEDPKDPHKALDEMAQFLQPDSRVDLKHIALDHLVGISASEDGFNALLYKEQIISSIIELTNDKTDVIAKYALLTLVNMTARQKGAAEILKYRPKSSRNIIQLMIDYVLNPHKKDVDAVCSILSNITRLEEELEVCLDTLIPQLNDILNVYVNLDYNKTGTNLHYLGTMFSNLSCSARVQKWLVEENPHVPLLKILPFCNYEQSKIRRGGAIGTIRNLTFDAAYHDLLLNPDLDILTYLLKPLMGNEEYPDDEMDSLPLSLQYLPEDKERETDEDIRTMILETLIKLCSKRNCREILRENGVYYILREYHKWEKDPKALLACENVVDILIQKESEVGAEDLSAVEVPEDYKEKFEKMDEDFLRDAAAAAGV